MKIKEAFKVYSYHQITEEEIYLSTGDIPIYTGNNDIKGYWNKEFLGTGEKYVPCISYPVKGNKGVCFVQYEIFDANNTGIIVPRDKYKDKIELEWFKFKFSKIILTIMTNNHGVGYLNKTDIENIEFTLLDKEQQLVELNLYKKAKIMEEKIDSIVYKINHILSKNIFMHDYENKKIKVGSILEYVSRNDKLSVEGIYNFCPKIDEDTIKVISGSLTDSFYGEISKSTKNIHYLNDNQCLNIITRGNAGRIKYLSKGSYATNTNSYLFYIPQDKYKALSLKNDDDIKIYLNFLKIYLEPRLLELATNGDVGIISLSDIMDVEIPTIQINDYIRDIVKEYYDLLNKRNQLMRIVDKISNLCSLIIIGE